MISDTIAIGTTPVRIDTNIPLSTVQFTPRADLWMGHNASVTASDGANRRKVTAGLPLEITLGPSGGVVGIWLVAASGTVQVDRTITGVNPA